MEIVKLRAILNILRESHPYRPIRVDLSPAELLEMIQLLAECEALNLPVTRDPREIRINVDALIRPADEEHCFCGEYTGTISCPMMLRNPEDLQEKSIYCRLFDEKQENNCGDFAKDRTTRVLKVKRLPQCKSAKLASS